MEGWGTSTEAWCAFHRKGLRVLGAWCPHVPHHGLGVQTGGTPSAAEPPRGREVAQKTPSDLRGARPR